MRNPLVSIIMPTYNADQYIFRGVDSCVEQSYSAWELIVVDDGSTDNTRAVVGRYVAEDKRIRYVYQGNSGVSAARNLGLHEAKGEYIVFLDSDDWLRKDALERLVQLQILYPDLLIACNRRLVSESELKESRYARFVDGCASEQISRKESLSENPSNIIETYLSRVDALCNTGTQKYNNSSVNKIFSKSVIERNQLQFDTDLDYGEDGLFVFRYLLAVKGMYHYNDCLWYLFERRGSATRRKFSEKNLASIRSVEKMREAIRVDLKRKDCRSIKKMNERESFAERQKLYGEESSEQYLAEADVAGIDHALQVYGGAIAYNLTRQCMGGDERDTVVERKLKSALRCYRRAYCQTSDAKGRIKYNVMAWMPFVIYGAVYRTTHKERL